MADSGHVGWNGGLAGQGEATVATTDDQSIGDEGSERTCSLLRVMPGDI
jgi:hypothetical protein